MRVKAGLTETKWKSRSSTATASVMLRSTSLAMRRSRSAVRLAEMSRAVPATRSGAAVVVAFDHAAARAHPGPCAVRAAHAVFGQEQRRLAAQVLPQPFMHARQVFGVDFVALLDVGLRPRSRARRCRPRRRACCASRRAAGRSPRTCSPDAHSASFRRSSRSRIWAKYSRLAAAALVRAASRSRRAAERRPAHRRPAQADVATAGGATRTGRRSSCGFHTPSRLVACAWNT